MSDSLATRTLTLVKSGTRGGAVTSYAPAASPPADPYVRMRLADAGGRGGVITEFAAAAERPPSYPVWLPFLPGRPVFATESARDALSPGARWPCDDRADAAMVLREVERASVAAGWEVAPRLRVAWEGGASERLVLVRERRGRVAWIVGVGERAVVQLLELPRTHLRERADVGA